MTDAQPTTDASGALAWASAVPRAPNGRMRAWLDVDATTDGRPDSMLWTASLVLLRHLESRCDEGFWRGKRVLELGSGMGHLAVGLARLGAHVTATEGGYGGHAVLQVWSRHLLQEREGGGEPAAEGQLSAGRNAHGGTLATRELWWGPDDGLSAGDGFDVVILSELVYDEDLHEPLLDTLGRALRPGATAYSIFCDRPFSFNFFAMLGDVTPPYELQQVEPAELLGLDTEHEDVHMHVITRPAASTAAPATVSKS